MKISDRCLAVTNNFGFTRVRVSAEGEEPKMSDALSGTVTLVIAGVTGVGGDHGSLLVPKHPAYGIGASQLRVWDSVLGWPLFMSSIVITATVLGMFAGEWKDCGSLPVRIQWTGVTVLALSISALTESSRYLQ